MNFEVDIEKAKAAFESYDIDGDGKITIDGKQTLVFSRNTWVQPFSTLLTAKSRGSQSCVHQI